MTRWRHPRARWRSSSSSPGATQLTVTLREAIRVLESMGMVTSRRRVGVTISPRSEWNAFDPVANLEWVSTLAHDWAADARLTRIDLTRVSAAGTLDLATGADVNPDPTDEAGVEFMRLSSEGWCRASIAYGTPHSKAKEAAARTAAFYTGG